MEMKLLILFSFLSPLYRVFFCFFYNAFLRASSHILLQIFSQNKISVDVFVALSSTHSNHERNKYENLRFDHNHVKHQLHPTHIASCDLIKDDNDGPFELI